MVKYYIAMHSSWGACQTYNMCHCYIDCLGQQNRILNCHPSKTILRVLQARNSVDLYCFPSIKEKKFESKHLQHVVFYLLLVQFLLSLYFTRCSGESYCCAKDIVQCSSQPHSTELPVLAPQARTCITQLEKAMPHRLYFEDFLCKKGRELLCIPGALILLQRGKIFFFSFLFLLTTPIWLSTLNIEEE